MEPLAPDINFTAVDIEGLDFTSDGDPPISSAETLLTSLPSEVSTAGTLLASLQSEGVYCSTTQTCNEPIFSNATLELTDYALSQNMTITSLEAQSLVQTFSQNENGLDSELESIAQSVQKSSAQNMVASFSNMTKGADIADSQNVCDTSLKADVTNAGVLDSEGFDEMTLFLNQQDLTSGGHLTPGGQLGCMDNQKSMQLEVAVSSSQNTQNSLVCTSQSSGLELQASHCMKQSLNSSLNNEHTGQSVINIHSFQASVAPPIGNIPNKEVKSNSGGLLGVSSILSPPASITTLAMTPTSTMTELQTVHTSLAPINLAATSQPLWQQPSQTIKSVTVSKISDNTTIVKVSFVPADEMTVLTDMGSEGQSVEIITQDASNMMEEVTSHTLASDSSSVKKRIVLGDETNVCIKEIERKGQGEPGGTGQNMDQSEERLSDETYDQGAGNMPDCHGGTVNNQICGTTLAEGFKQTDGSIVSGGEGEIDGSTTVVSQILEMSGVDELACDKADEDSSTDNAGHAIVLDRMELNIHINDSQCIIIDGQRRWKCNLCDKTYTTKHNLITHILGHSGIKPHCCMLCGKFFKQMSHLNTHMLIHCNVRPHLCKICGRTFTQASHVKRHMAIHMDRRPYVCEVCNRGFAYPSELKAHGQKHKKKEENTCEECTEGFENQKQLKNHQRTCHRNVADLTCKECGKVYMYPSQLRDHLIKHSSTRPYMCGECGMEFMKEHHLKAHQFTHTGLKPWQCHICKRAFNQKANLQRHMLIHNDEKKYKCDSCDRMFAQPQTLKAHKVTHSEKKPFQCRICGKEFGRLHNLQGHMHMHQDSKPHICFCGASFTLNGNLTRHKKVKHGITDPGECTEEEAAKILNSMSGKRSVPDDSDTEELSHKQAMSGGEEEEKDEEEDSQSEQDEEEQPESDKEKQIKTVDDNRTQCSNTVEDLSDGNDENQNTNVEHPSRNDLIQSNVHHMQPNHKKSDNESKSKDKRSDDGSANLETLATILAKKFCSDNT